MNKSQKIILIAAMVLFAAVLFTIPSSVEWPARSTIAVMVFGLILWAFAPIPLELTSVIVIMLLMVMRPVETEVIFSGFSSPATFLIIAGMMMAIGVNHTLLVKRMTYGLLSLTGRTTKGIFISYFVLIQIQAFFIPATAVRTSMMLPIVENIVKETESDKESNFSKLLYIGAAFGNNVSGVVVLTAAVGNILAVEMLRIYLGTSVSYVEWFIYVVPIWFLLAIAVMFILWKSFKPEVQTFPRLKESMREKYMQLGKLTLSEKKCIIILGVTILIWLTESVHGYHPTFAALLAVILMSMPVTGIVEWNKMININYGIVLLVGGTLSLGYTLVESGAIELLENLLFTETVINIFSNPWTAVPLVIIFSQIYHLGVTNVQTAVVTLVPVLISLSLEAGIDPVVVTVAAAVSILLGFILVVETMPNVVVESTGRVMQQDFIKPGIYITVASVIIMIAVAFTYWRWIDFWP